ncbi:hypothetical protein Plhal304r1_c061g0148541 [Plasmopara halstedii]
MLGQYTHAGSTLAHHACNPSSLYRLIATTLCSGSAHCFRYCWSYGWSTQPPAYHSADPI